MKNCSKCGSLKEYKEFYSDPRNKKTGLRSDCKKCAIEASRNYQRNNLGHYREYQRNIRHNNIGYIYSSRYDKMCRRARGYYKRYHSSINKEVLTREEFDRWCEQNKSEFDKIYKVWKKSNFAYRYSPTIDRKNNNVGYIPSNMQWLSMIDNIMKEKVPSG